MKKCRLPRKKKKAIKKMGGVYPMMKASEFSWRIKESKISRVQFDLEYDKTWSDIFSRSLGASKAVELLRDAMIKLPPPEFPIIPSLIQQP